MAGVTYDKGALDRARRDFESLKLGAYVPRLSQLVAMGGVKLTMDCFRKQLDPYGRPWKPLARERTRDKRARLRAVAKGKKVRGQKILIDTSRMRNSTTAIQQGRSGGVAIPTGYAAVHQNGAHIAPHSRIGVAHYQLGRSSSRGIPRIGVKRTRENARGTAGSRRIAGFYNATFAEGITIPQRMMLPTPEMGLPATWHKMIQREVVGLMRRWVEKGARQ
jgi:hypothetical protein